MSPTRHTALGPGGEFALIEKMRKRWGDLAAGIGDDAAVLTVPRGEQLVASTDAAVEDVHFKRKWLTSREIGYRAVTAALSDLAAMAATPLGVLVSLQLPKSRRGDVPKLADGIGDAVRAAGTVIRGGNLSQGDVIVITTTVLGHAFTPLTRGGARPGDLLYVTGNLGGPAAALKALKARKRLTTEVWKRFAHPVARIAEARWLAARGAVAAIDISDGLAADAEHIAAASDAGLELKLDHLPLLKGVRAQEALWSGEEYELLVVSRIPVHEAEFQARFKIPITAVGRVMNGRARVHITAAKRVARGKGYDHFSR